MENQITSWAELSLNDLFFAFRKAKVDCFFETSIRVAEKFVEYEEDLGERLASLLQRLQLGLIADILSEGLGEPAIFPKKVKMETADESNPAHSFFSDAKRSFLRDKRRGMTPEFRMIGDFSVDVHVVSALWVNLVGHKFDAQLPPSALASRLRRYRKDSSGNQIGAYHLEAIGSFEPYFEPYQRWRDMGLASIKSNLENGRGVVALTLDVSNFYHSIDPRFAIDPRFHEYAGIDVDEFEVAFTTDIIRSEERRVGKECCR